MELSDDIENSNFQIIASLIPHKVIKKSKNFFFFSFSPLLLILLHKLLELIAKKEKIRLEQTIAVGDGANDLPMLGKAGLGIAFRAKPIVRESARQAISTLGLDAILYLMGFRDRDDLSINQQIPQTAQNLS